MSKAAKVVSSAILGMDFETIMVNGKPYVIMPPTIHKIAGAGNYLSDLGDGESIKALLLSMKNIESASKALSCLIQGDESLIEELSQGTMEEVVNGLEIALSLISAENFYKLSALTKNVEKLTAKQKQ